MDSEHGLPPGIPPRAGSAVIRQQSEPSRRIEIVSGYRP